MLHKLLMVFLLFCISIVTFLITRSPIPEVQTETVQAGVGKPVDIDKFIADSKDSKPRRLFGSLEVRDILTKCVGDPLNPTEDGAVLTDINTVSYAVLGVKKKTEPSKLKDFQLVFYITSGNGEITSENKTAALSVGNGVLMPPDTEFTLTNTGNDKLTMYLIEEPIPSGFKPRSSMLVKYEYDNPISSNIKRVNDVRKFLFSLHDGLSSLVGINPVMWAPKTLYYPHVHREGDEEIWISITGDFLVQLGSKRRSLPAGSAYKVPADSRTAHININQTEVSQKLLWLYKVPLRAAPPRRPKRSDNDVI